MISAFRNKARIMLGLPETSAGIGVRILGLVSLEAFISMVLNRSGFTAGRV
jgi:hypothetical protein